MKWRKLGVVWKPDGKLWWARTHASCPTPVRLDDGTLRIYVQCRDDKNVGRVGFVDIDPSDPLRVLGCSEAPVLDIGAPGAFDDNGVFQTSIVSAGDGRLLMYYVGFELCHHVRYRLLTGLAASTDGGRHFERVKTTPVLERSDAERLFRCGPFVEVTNGVYRMWYLGGSDWTNPGGKAMPVYDLRYIESADGITWPDRGRVLMQPAEQEEHGFGRPYILRDGGLYRMFYSIRRRMPQQYRMGYAESKDGMSWIRKDEQLGIDVSATGWDSESIEFAAIAKTAGSTFMFYNGNDFGATGFGVAELESDQ
jgi:predicted GH43/DUF377 family glycosyl hydrolase